MSDRTILTVPLKGTGGRIYRCIVAFHYPWWCRPFLRLPYVIVRHLPKETIYDYVLVSELHPAGANTDPVDWENADNAASLATLRGSYAVDDGDTNDRSDDIPSTPTLEDT